MFNYVVQPRDCLDCIATQFGLSVDAILAVNPGLNHCNICPGRVIMIPDTSRQQNTADDPPIFTRVGMMPRFPFRSFPFPRGFFESFPERREFFESFPGESLGDFFERFPDRRELFERFPDEFVERFPDEFFEGFPERREEFFEAFPRMREEFFDRFPRMREEFRGRFPGRR